MANSLAMARVLLIIALWPISTAAILQVNYPLNLQLPPVALVGFAYQYQFPSTTFQADSDKVEYSLIGSPSWLSLDSNSRTLSGSPRISDVGVISFIIAAAGSAGAVVNMDSKLLVSKDDGPKADGNVTQILSNTGPISGPSTINLGPSRPFDISFPPDTFQSNGTSLSYYALLSDHTPLPAWISFDASSLHFAGNTPPISSMQTFEILLVACITPGYAASSLSFTMAISNHQLIFQPYSQYFNISKGGDVQITGLRNKLFLDGSPIKDSQIQSITAKLPAWLKLDNETSEISGSPPSGTMSQDLTITANDQFGDVAQFNIHLLFTSKVFAKEIGQLNATIGESFEYAIPKGTLTENDEKLFVNLSSLSRYLQFDPATSTIAGKIPPGFPSQKIPCMLTANSSDGTMTDTQTFQIVVSKAAGDGPSGAPAGGANTTSTDGKKPGGKMAGIIISSIIGAICGTLLLAMLALCLRRRKKSNSYLNPRLPRSLKKSDIGRPELDLGEWQHGDVDQEEDLEKGKDERDLLMERTLEDPPKLDLDVPIDQRDSLSLRDSNSDVDTKILDTFDESSWGIQHDTAPSQHPHDSMRIPTELAKRSSQKSDSFRKHRRRTTTVYGDQIHRSSGLPINRRITRAGHGRQTYSPTRSNTNVLQSSLRRALSTSSYTTTRCTSTISTSPSTFPQPPVAQLHTAEVTTPVEQRRGIRVVPASNRSSLVDCQTLDEKRNSYIRKRTSTQSPFFSAAGSSRVSSSTYRSPPAFIAEVPTARNTIVGPNDDVVERRSKQLPDSLDIPNPSANLAFETRSKDFPGSLRKYRLPRPYTSMGINRDRVEKTYVRPGTSIGHSVTSIGRRASTRDSLRAYELKAKLNDLTGSEIFKDAELSDSVYTDEDNEIEEAEKRITVKPGQFTLPPLNIDTRRRSKRDKAEKKKRASKRDSQRELKRTSERDPTPYFLSYQSEHGGKENQSSTYSLGIRSTPARAETPGEAKITASPERPKQRAHHSPTTSDVRKSHQNGTRHTPRVLSQQGPIKERHSRKSIHSHTQLQQSTPAGKKTHSHSRSQSSAYPYFDPSSLEIRPSSIGNMMTRPSSIGNAITTAADSVCMPDSATKSSLITRDLSGNVTFHNADEEPAIEESRSSLTNHRTSKGRVNSSARLSRLTNLHESSPPPPRSSKRETAFRFPSSSPTAVRSAGLGLFPLDARAELCAGERERMPLSVLANENTGVEESTLDVQKGRQTWGSLKSIVGRGGRWVSGGLWGKEDDSQKVFI